VAVVAGTTPAPASEPAVVTAKAESSVERLGVGESASIAVEAQIADGWHINGPGVQEGLEFLIPTALTFDLPEGVRAEGVRFPEPVVRTLQLAGSRELAVYEGLVRIDARLLYDRRAEGASAPFAVLRYQACTATLCTRPTSLRIALPVELAAAAGSVSIARNRSAPPAAVYFVYPVSSVPLTDRTAAPAALPFEPFTAEAYDRARASRKPFVVEFTADWCLPCKQMAERTFTDPRVLLAGEGLTFLSVDMTTSDRHKELILESFGVPGAPTTLFFGADGKEITRRVGFIGPEEFARLLEEARGRPGAERRGGETPRGI
jgi:thiol-disulfide isomerase/thioredoxin